METQCSVVAPCDEENGELDAPDDAALAVMVPVRFGVRDERTADWLFLSSLSDNPVGHVGQIERLCDVRMLFGFDKPPGINRIARKN